MATTCPSGWDRVAWVRRRAARSARSSRASSRWAGSVIVAAVAQQRAWSATTCPAQVTTTRAGVASTSTNRPIARGSTVVVGVDAHVVVPGQPDPVGQPDRGCDRRQRHQRGPVAPAIGLTNRVRLARDYYVRIDSNDYSVDPRAIGRFVDVLATR